MFFKPLHIVSIVLLGAINLIAPKVKAQFFELPANKKRVSVPFKMVRNMVVVQTKIDGKGPFNFVMDSGVGIIIITDPKLVDSVGVKSTRTLKLSGLGTGESYTASVCSDLNFDIFGIKANGLSAAMMNDDRFGLSNYAGMPIHGLIGFDFFNSLAVKFNFLDSTLTAARSGTLKEFKKGYKIPISIEDNKPYIHSYIKFANEPLLDAKLIVDFGAGHSLLLENRIKENTLPTKFINANLGVGLNGPVEGLLARVAEIEIGKYKFKNVITSFPIRDPLSQYEVPRDGNLGLGILKRFTLILDYQKNLLLLQPGREFKQPFEHDMSGLEYYGDGDDYKTIVINRVEPGSAADDAGLLKDDAIVMINFKPVSEMSIQRIDDLFKSFDDRSLLIDIVRGKKQMRFIMTLKRRI